MSEIGGYFGLELTQGNQHYHASLYKMKSGRSSVGFLLGNLKPIHVYLPFYTCDALLEPFDANNISYSFYSINKNFEIAILPELKAGEMLVYINYYGIKDEYVETLSVKYADKLVVDCTQAYFTKGNGLSWFFNSTRKFFGVPDGSDLYVPKGYNLEDAYNVLPINVDYITDHLVARFKGNTQQGSSYFQQNETLNGGEAAKMSEMTQRLLSNIDFEKTKEIRKENFNYLHRHLQDSNQLELFACPASTPFFYPYLPAYPVEKRMLWAENIYVPVFWSDCLQRKDAIKFPVEKELSENLVPIPIDHRCTFVQMDNILAFLKTTK